MDMAYASLTSLAQILDHIFCHIRNHLLYNRQQIESLREKVSFLQDFIEDCDQRRINVTQELEHQIKSVAHQAEDVIETKMVDDILGRSPRPLEGSTLFCQKIEELIQNLDSVQKMVVGTKERESLKYDPSSRKSFGTSLSGVVRPGGKISAVVGLEDHLIRVMDELTGQQARRLIFPIVGMGGIGKTTLCRNVFENPLIVQHFHVCAWITVSQEYSVREIIERLLGEIIVPFEEEDQESTEDSGKEPRDDQLGEKLYKGLSGRKYLIVMDDVWDVDVWDELKMYLPDNGNGSRIMVTTRQADVAHMLSSCSPYRMDFLDEEQSWSLLCQIVFGQESHPVEFEDVGRQIARNCRGLPLAIVVVGGLLSKSDMTEDYWEYVAQHLSSVVNSENEEHCLSMLYLSYKHLPLHLKPCFLHMGTFPEDREIHVSKLIKLWVAEGFLKPISGKSLEEVAEDYLQDLVDRNLVLVGTRKSSAKMRSCGIHDLLRDLCSKVAHKENFFWLITETVPGSNLLGNQRDSEESPQHILGSGTHIFRKIKRGISNFFRPKGGDRPPSSPLPIPNPYSLNIPSNIKDTRRLVIPLYRFGQWSQIYRRVKSASSTRSLFSNDLYLVGHLFFCFRLLRIIDELNDYSPETIREIVNSRYLACRVRHSHLTSTIPPSIRLLRNLQTLVVKSNSSDKSAKLIALPSEIWDMPQLRHIEIQNAVLPDPPRARVPTTDTRSHYLHNLLTLSTIRNFRCSNDNVLERIPNLKKLKIGGDGSPMSYYLLNNLVRLKNLESLICKNQGMILLGNQAFPDSIKKLSLIRCRLRLEDMSIIGSLPNLEVLKLCETWDAVDWDWSTVEGEFLNLKFLSLQELNLVHWEAESSHFPRLESLIVRFCYKLEEIPFGIGEIPTLKLMELYHCGEEASSSAEQIQEEQSSLGNEDLQVRVVRNTFLGNVWNESAEYNDLPFGEEGSNQHVYDLEDESYDDLQVGEEGSNQHVYDLEDESPEYNDLQVGEEGRNQHVYDLEDESPEYNDLQVGEEGSHQHVYDLEDESPKYNDLRVGEEGSDQHAYDLEDESSWDISSGGSGDEGPKILSSSPTK